jgi:hypothetical protein
MQRMLLAAAIAALTFAGVPAFSQTSECPPGTTTTNADGSPVTCDRDDNVNDVTGTTDDSSAGPAQPRQGDNVLDNTNAGQGIKDALGNTNDNGGGGKS